MRFRMHHGFTLIELSAVIATIGIMAAILLPGLARAREAARRSSCAAALVQLGMAAHMYASEHDRLLPWSGGDDNADCLRLLCTDYVLDVQCFMCPSNAFFGSSLKLMREKKQSYTMNTDLRLCDSLRSSYDYVGAYSYRPIRLPHPSRPVLPLPLFWDGASPSSKTGYSNHIHGVNVVYLDGHVAWIGHDRFSAPGLPVSPPGIDLMPPAQAWEAAAQRPAWNENCR